MRVCPLHQCSHLRVKATVPICPRKHASQTLYRTRRATSALFCSDLSPWAGVHNNNAGWKYLFFPVGDKLWNKNESKLINKSPYIKVKTFRMKQKQ